PVAPGQRGQGGRQYPEPGLVGTAVPVPRGARYRAAVDGQPDPGQASASLADRPVRVGSECDPGADGGPSVAGGQPAIRHRDALDGVPAAAGEGPGLPP